MSDVDSTSAKPSKAVKSASASVATVSGAIKVLTPTLTPRKYELVNRAQLEFEGLHPGVKNVTLQGIEHHSGTSVTYNFIGEL